MLSQILLQYTKYNHWANDKLLSLILKNAKSELLDKEIVSSFSSLRKTVYHLWDAELIWLKRLNGESLNAWPGNSFKGSFSEAKDEILKNDISFIDFVSAKNTHDLLAPFTYKNVEGKSFSNPVWESIHHCMNHSTYHRGQIVTMLRQLSVPDIVSTDFIAYCRIAESSNK